MENKQVTKTCEKCGREFKCSPSHAPKRKNCSYYCSNHGIRKNTGKTHFKPGHKPWSTGGGYKSPNRSEIMKDAWERGKFDNREIDYNLNAKKISATQRGISIEDWDGFVHVKKYTNEFYKKKDFIKKRDNYTCQICGAFDCILDIHHIDYNKNNNLINNLITLCHSCHSKTNYNREHYGNYFQNKLKGGNIMENNMIQNVC